MREYGVVLFHTTSDAFEAERAMVDEGLDYRLVPTPRELSSDCGIALQFLWEQQDEVGNALKKHLVDFEAIHHL